MVFCYAGRRIYPHLFIGIRSKFQESIILQRIPAGSFSFWFALGRVFSLDLFDGFLTKIINSHECKRSPENRFDDSLVKNTLPYAFEITARIKWKKYLDLFSSSKYEHFEKECL
jgi:hypothetical protein